MLIQSNTKHAHKSIATKIWGLNCLALYDIAMYYIKLYLLTYEGVDRPGDKLCELVYRRPPLGRCDNNQCKALLRGSVSKQWNQIPNIHSYLMQLNIKHTLKSNAVKFQTYTQIRYNQISKLHYNLMQSNTKHTFKNIMQSNTMIHSNLI